MKNAFSGVHILLYRRIFRQWASFSEQAWRGNSWFFETTKAQLQRNRHDSFVDKLVNVFGIDEFSPDNANSFYIFTAVHLYLYSRAVDYVDLVIDLSKIAVEEKYRLDTEAFVNAAGLAVDLSGTKDSFAFSVCPIVQSELIQWLSVIGDWVCEEASVSGRLFVEQAITEIVSDVKQYELFAGAIRSFLQTRISNSEIGNAKLASKVRDLQSQIDCHQSQIVQLLVRNSELQSDLLTLRDKTDEAGRELNRQVCELELLKEREVLALAEVQKLSVIENRQRKELEILQSRSPLQRLLHRNRIRDIQRFCQTGTRDRP